VLDLKGCIVTADAMGCQRDIAAGIVAAGANYILSLKGNQGKLHEQVAAFLDGMIADGLEANSTEDHGRGRVEHRRCWAIEGLDWLDGAGAWEGLRSIAAVELERTEKGGNECGEALLYNKLGAGCEEVGARGEVALGNRELVALGARRGVR
jgi:hypothetical protein